MAFVGVAGALAGSAAIGAGASIYGGMQQAKAAKKSANVQQDALSSGIQTQRSGQAQALNYLDPFRQYGLNAGSTIQSLLYSPGQLEGQQASERSRMESDIAALQEKNLSWDAWRAQYGAQYTGGKGLKRSRSGYSQYATGINQQLQAAQSKLDAFNKQAEVQKQYAGQAQDVQASPWYQFQADLLNRSQDRAFAARGLTGSGFEAEERRRGLLELGAGETERQFARLQGIYNTGANAANVGAGTLTNTSQAIANNQIQSGNAQAAGYRGVAGANAETATNIANSVTGAAGTYLNYTQMQNLINRNQSYGMPNTGLTPTYFDDTAGGVAQYGTGPNKFLVNPPR